MYGAKCEQLNYNYTFPCTLVVIAPVTCSCYDDLFDFIPRSLLMRSDLSIVMDLFHFVLPVT